MDLKPFYKENVEQKEEFLREIVKEHKVLISKDYEHRYAHYALFNFNLMPWEFFNLSQREKAMLIAMIDKKISETGRKSK